MLEGISQVRARIAEIEAGLAALRRERPPVPFASVVEEALRAANASGPLESGPVAADPERVGRLQAYMRKRLFDPGLAAHASDFVEAAERYGVDWRLATVLATVESSGGKNCFRPYNPFGIMGRSFSSWREAIYEVNRLVAGYGFGNDVVRILRKYNPSGGDAYVRSVLAEMERI
ncbi:MAG: hypothetical protein WHT46_03205 [Candidatus Geothermincolales bacterium]